MFKPVKPKVVQDGPKTGDVNATSDKMSTNKYESIESTSNQVVCVGFLRDKHITMVAQIRVSKDTQMADKG